MNNEILIHKKMISLEELDIYDEEKIEQSKFILRDIIENVVVNDFSFLTTLYDISLKERKSIDEVYENYHAEVSVRDCIGLSKILKERLEDRGISTYFVTCKASGFSTKYGDDFIREAHTFLLYPCLRDGRVAFVLYDPGFRVMEPMFFYAGESSFSYPYLNGFIQVRFENHQYYLYSNVRMKRDFSIVPESVSFFFQPFMETLDMDAFAKNIFRVKFSYKIMNYHKEMDYRYCLGLNVVTKQLDFYTRYYHEQYLLQEFLDMPLESQLQHLQFLRKDGLFNYQDMIELLEIFKIYSQKNIPILERKIVKDWK